jgi:hypothetical protein
MFQLTTYHNEYSEETLEDFIQIAVDSGLTVVSQLMDAQDETTLVLQGTKDQFFTWNEYFMEGGPSWNEEEFMEELVEVEAA